MSYFTLIFHFAWYLKRKHMIKETYTQVANIKQTSL